MLDSMRRGQRWLTAIFVGVIGLVFAAFIGLGGPMSGPTGSAVVEIDGLQLGILDFERVREVQEQRYRDQLGDQFDARTARDFLDSQALRVLVDSAVMARAAEELGFRVSKEEIQRTVRNLPGFRDEAGRFDQQRFIEEVEWAYGSQRNFLRIMREDLLKLKLGRLLWSQARVSEGEARSAARLQLEQVAIAYVALDTAVLPPGVEVSETEVEAAAATHEEALRADFESRRGDFRLPEAVRARHVLVRVSRDASEEDAAAALEQAGDVRGRIVEGASFEDVAMEVSEDPGSAEQGGDLGFVVPGDVATELEAWIFAGDPGDLSEPIRTDAGYHVVRIEENREASDRPFDEVRLELARQRAESDKAATLARRLAEELSNAVANGESLEDAARARDLTLERTDRIRRRPDSFLPGLGSSAELQAAVFALDEDDPTPSRIFEVGPRLVLVELIERVDPDPAELERAVDAARTELLEAKRNSLIQDWIDAERASLEQQGLLVVNASAVLDR